MKMKPVCILTYLNQSSSCCDAWLQGLSKLMLIFLQSRSQSHGDRLMTNYAYILSLTIICNGGDNFITAELVHP